MVIIETIDCEELILETKEVLIEIADYKQQLLAHIKSLTESTIH